LSCFLPDFEQVAQIVQPKFILLDSSGIGNIDIATYTTIDMVQIMGDFHVFNLVLDGFSASSKSDFFQKFSKFN